MRGNMDNNLPNELVNKGRQVELDLAKYLSTLFMIFLHCLMVTSGFKNDISIYLQRGIGQLLGGPFAAPVFMFLMGNGIVYSKNQDPLYLIKRGISMILLGFVVNIGEFFLPNYLAGKLLGEWNIFPTAGGLLLFCVDILAFAGMAMILIGVLKKAGLSAWQMFFIAVGMSIVGSFLRFHDFGSAIPNLLAGYFIGSAGGFTAFPLFNWFIFPTAGVLLGEFYIRSDDPEAMLRFWPAGLAVSIAYFVTSWTRPEGFLSEIHHYYFMTTIDAVFCLICIYGFIGLCYFVSMLLSDSAKAFISKTSANVNTIYVLQWFLIPVTYILICYFKRDIVFGDLSLIIIAVLEIAACTEIAAGFKYISKYIQNRKEGAKENDTKKG